MNRRVKIYQVLAALLALGMLLLAAAVVPADVRAEGEGPDCYVSKWDPELDPLRPSGVHGGHRPRGWHLAG
ncbi:MAG: hypothetical protein KGY46_02545 [Anaerolineales bacterium]|nr:hypothetical protein [Anaerolineales bacterium]